MTWILQLDVGGKGSEIQAGTSADVARCHTCISKCHSEETIGSRCQLCLLLRIRGHYQAVSDLIN